MIFYSLLLVIVCPCCTAGQLLNISETDFESRRIEIIVDIVTSNLKTNGWSTILCFGSLPDKFYSNLQNISHTFAVTNIEHTDEDIDDVVQYYSNTIVISLKYIQDYEETVLKLIKSPYWHPYANIILYYHEKNHEILAKIYFSFWYYRAINVIIVQYDDDQETLSLSYYTPYISDGYKLDYMYGCWTTRKIGMPVSSFDDGFSCVEQCHNVSIHSKLRANNLGTCIGFNIITVPYNASGILTNLNLFEDKSKNLHGFTFRAFATEVEPFFIIIDNRNGSYKLKSRDGMLWNTLSEQMNFSIDLTSNKNVMKEPFNFELNINQLFSFAFRKGDFYLVPIYLFDVAVIEVDYTFPYKESGVCFLSHRAEFDTTLFDAKMLHANRSIITQFVLCFLCVWFTFSIYQAIEKGRLSFDQIGKDLLNTFRNILLVTLCNPPRWPSFRIFLTITIWSFFVVNFANQATIISLLTAAKRGKDVETFDDVIEKGYPIYGMASPDLILPDTEEKFRIINSRLVPVQDLFGCVRNITSNRDRFCLIDCSVGRYLERNRLNENGEQYLHIARDRIHSHYLTMLLSKHSPLTERFDKYLITIYEAGLFKKWEQYRFTEIKEEPLTKALGMEDFNSLFHIYSFSLGLLFIIFLLELLIFYIKRILKYVFCKQCDKKINQIDFSIKTN